MSLSFFHSGEFYSSFCALLWAIAVILFRKSGKHVAPVPLNLFKNTLGLVLFLLSMLLLGIPLNPPERTAEEWSFLLLSGVLGIGIADSLFFASLNRLGAGRLAIVDCLYSPFVILCSFGFLGEPIGLGLFVSLALLIGAILIGTWNPEPADSPRQRREILQGVLLGVASMLLMAVGIVLAKPVLDRSDPWWATTVRLIGGLGLLALQGLTRRHRREVARCFRPGPLWKYTIPGSVIGAYVALFFWILGMKYTYANIASVLNQMSTVFVLLLATAFLKEPLTKQKMIAIILGFCGGAIAAL